MFPTMFKHREILKKKDMKPVVRSPVDGVILTPVVALTSGKTQKTPSNTR